MKNYILVIMCFTCALLAPLQVAKCNGLGVVKEWVYPSKKGDVRVVLTVPPNKPNDLIYSITSEFDAPLTQGDYFDVLVKAFDNSAASGYDPKNTILVSTMIHDSEYRKDIKNIVIKSDKLKSCIRSKHCYELDRGIMEYFKYVSAFSELNKIFGKYNLSIKSVSVDNVSVGMADGEINCDGSILIYLHPVQSTNRVKKGESR